MFKKSGVMLIVFMVLAFSFTVAFSGERGFMRSPEKSCVCAENSAAGCLCENMKACGDSQNCKVKASVKCTMADCKCENCLCGDNCSMKKDAALCGKNAEAKSCACEKSAVKKAEIKNCACCASCECAKIGECSKSKTACCMSDNSSCKNGSGCAGKAKAAKMGCEGGKCGK
ncbi:MAG: hypothetical protein BWY32_00508 [bacterium ADurb.Bin243]|nr:MAG: hypothetical protein BWY32_00508 [bacterium ADurb.Bin243]